MNFFNSPISQVYFTTSRSPMAFRVFLGTKTESDWNEYSASDIIHFQTDSDRQ